MKLQYGIIAFLGGLMSFGYALPTSDMLSPKNVEGLPAVEPRSSGCTSCLAEALAKNIFKDQSKSEVKSTCTTCGTIELDVLYPVVSKLTKGGLDALKIAQPELAPEIEGVQVAGNLVLTLENFLKKIDI